MSGRRRRLGLLVALMGGIAAQGATASAPMPRMLAFSTARAVYVVRSNGTGERLVAAARDGESIEGVTWSPDGRHLAYGANFASGSAIEIASLDSAEGWLTIPTTSGTSISEPPTWSPDGRHIAFVTSAVPCTCRPNVSTVHVITTDGRSDLKLGAGSAPSWSPFGNELTYVTLQGELVVADLDHPLTRRTVSPAGVRAVRPTWSPNGLEIAFVGGWAYDYASKPPTVWTVEPDGSAPRNLHIAAFEGSGGFNSWTYDPIVWAPDSNTIVVRSPDGYGALIVARPDGSDRRELPSNDGWSLGWAPDGSGITYVNHFDDGRTIQLISVDGTSKRTIATDTEQIEQVAWMP